MTEGNTWINAVIGSVVTVFSAPIFPISPIAGGAVAGYLEGGELSDGAVVGVIAGAIALLPLLLVIGFLGGLTLLAPTIGFPGGIAALGFIAIFFGIVVLGVYAIGFSALGGVLGAYVRTETAFGS